MASLQNLVVQYRLWYRNTYNRVQVCPRFRSNHFANWWEVLRFSIFKNKKKSFKFVSLSCLSLFELKKWFRWFCMRTSTLAETVECWKLSGKMSNLVILRMVPMLGQLRQWSTNSTSFLSDRGKHAQCQLRQEPSWTNQTNMQYEAMPDVVGRTMDRMLRLLWQWIPWKVNFRLFPSKQLF